MPWKRHRLNEIGNHDISGKQAAMGEQISRYLPSFRDSFRFSGVQFAIKTNPLGMAADRSCAVYRDERIFTVLSGKIDTIFFATERILSLLESSRIGKAPKRYAILDDIVLPASSQAGTRTIPHRGVKPSPANFNLEIHLRMERLAE